MAAHDDPRPPRPAPWEETAQELYDHSPCGHISSLPDGTILGANETLLGWTGYRREELVGRKRFQDLLSPGDRIYHETHYAPLLRMQGAVREIAVELLCADGRRLSALVNSVLKVDADGRPLGVRTAVFPASSRREYERELLRARRRAEQADKAKADFISMVSHEVRNPLSAIVQAVHVLGATSPTPRQQEIIRIIRSSSSSLASLVNHILDLSRLDSGHAALERRVFDLRELVEGVVLGHSAQAEEKGIALEARIDPAVPERLLGDPVKIRQVVANLVSNAVKFTSQGSVTAAVELRELTPDAASLLFRVTDTGIGISPEARSRIFEDFVQADYDVSLKYGGTGLGLAISRRLVEMHGSRLEVESAQGSGSTFSFGLVLALPPPEGPQP